MCPITFGPCSGLPATQHETQTLLVAWEIFLKNVSWTTELHLIPFHGMPFFLLCPQIYSGGLLAVAASAWSSKGRGWAGAVWEEPSRRHKVWPAAPAAKKTAVAEQLEKAIAATQWLGQSKRDRDWQAEMWNTTLWQGSWATYSLW